MTCTNGQSAKFPFDYDSLSKGDVIPVEKIEEIIQHTYGTLSYQLGCLKLCGEIERQMSLRGPHPTLKISKGAILILRDNEATVTCEDRIRIDLHRAIRNYGRLSQVVIANLDDEDKKRHDARLLVNGRLLQSLARERKAIAQERHLKESTIPHNTAGLPALSGTPSP